MPENLTDTLGKAVVKRMARPVWDSWDTLPKDIYVLEHAVAALAKLREADKGAK